MPSATYGSVVRSELSCGGDCLHCHGASSVENHITLAEEVAEEVAKEAEKKKEAAAKAAQVKKGE